VQINRDQNKRIDFEGFSPLCELKYSTQPIKQEPALNGQNSLAIDRHNHLWLNYKRSWMSQPMA
jgi:hypothetical protein